MSAATVFMRHRPLLARRFRLLVSAMLGCVSATASLSMADETRTRRVSPKDNDSLIACCDGCLSVTCLRSCIDHERQRGAVRGQLFLAQARGDVEEGRLPADVSLAVREAIDNIAFCADRYANLLASEFDEAEYNVCAWGAAYVYLRRTGWAEALEAAEEGRDAVVTGDITALATGLELVVHVAEATQAAVVASAEASASGGVATPLENEERTPFEQCIDKRNANRDACDAAYPEGSADRTTCYEGADIAFKECAKKAA